MAKTVIAIEDDPQIAELIRLLLASDDVELMHYSDGPRGLEGVLELQPDLVLLDIMVPGLNGWEVFDRIRASESVRHVPIIVLSVTPQSFERRVGFSQSAVDFYMSKPFDILALRERIDTLLKVTSWHVGNQMPVPRRTKAPIKPITTRLIRQTQRMRRIELQKTSTGELVEKTVSTDAPIENKSTGTAKASSVDVSGAIKSSTGDEEASGSA